MGAERSTQTRPYRILDPSFAKYRLNNAGIERLAVGMRWAEGPVWFGDGRYLLWSDAALDRITRWDEETGQVSIFRKPANKPNGLTRDRQGRLLTCEHAGRRVTRTEYDGTITVLIDRFDGKRLNSPNDIMVKSDNSIWFTDPCTASPATIPASSTRRNCQPTSTGSIKAVVNAENLRRYAIFDDVQLRLVGPSHPDG